MLTEARAAALLPGVELEEIKAEIVDVEPGDTGLRLRGGGGQYFFATHAVLAIGNLPGEYPISRDASDLSFAELCARALAPGCAGRHPA